MTRVSSGSIISGVILFALISLVGLTETSYAYIGPGAGLTAIGTVLALIAAFFLAIVGFVWYPVKRLLQKWNANARQPERSADEN